MKKILFLLSIILSSTCVADIHQDKTYICGQDVDCTAQGIITEINTKIPITGAVQEYNDDSLVMEFFCKDGKADGIVKSYRDGQIHLTIAMENGIPNGSFLLYHGRGGGWTKGSLKNGLQEDVTKDYNKEGKVEQEISFHNGELNGSRKIYSQNGLLISETIYKMGTREVSKDYNNNGKLESIRHYRDGKIYMIENYKDGKLESIMYRDGEMIEHYKDGKLIEIDPVHPLVFFETGPSVPSLQFNVPGSEVPVLICLF